MWFLFGFITLTGFVLYAAYRRRDARWKGVEYQAAGLSYAYQNYTNREGRIEWFRIGIVAPPGFDFALKPERLTDRFFKSVGICREFQLNDEAFDRRIYLVSDDASVRSSLGSSATLRGELVALFEDRDRTRRMEGIRCHSGRLWARYKVRKGFNDPAANVLAGDVIPVLARLAKALGAQPQEMPPRQRDPFIFRAAIILAISSGLVINGIAQMMRIDRGELPSTVEPGGLLLPAFVGAACVVILLLIAAVGWL